MQRPMTPCLSLGVPKLNKVTGDGTIKRDLTKNPDVGAQMRCS